MTRRLLVTWSLCLWSINSPAPASRVAEIIPTLNNTGFMLSSGTEDPYIQLYKALAWDTAQQRSILEFAVGGGDITLDVVAGIETGTKIVAIDKEARHLELVWKNAADRFGIEGLGFVKDRLVTVQNFLGTARLPPYPEVPFFDTFVALRVLHQWTQLQIEEFLRDAFDKMRVGGEIIITMESANLAFVPEDLRREYFAGKEDNFLYLPDITRWFTDRQGGRSLATPTSLRAAAERVGFRPVRSSYILRTGYPVPLSHEDPAVADLRLGVGFFGYKPFSSDPSLDRSTCADLIRLSARTMRPERP